uniref:seipin isoform X1 n=3 Tax=Myxine glutinosa TaxID=7769 RepID=UPI00358EDCB9
MKETALSAKKEVVVAGARRLTSHLIGIWRDRASVLSNIIMVTDVMGVELGPLLLWMQEMMVIWGSKLRRAILQTCVVACIAALLLWISAFLYGAFYSSYMPAVSFATPVHFIFRSDCESRDELCSFPVANVSFLRDGREKVLFPGTPYSITLDLDLPESPTNQQLGMFIVTMTTYANGGKALMTATKSAMLHYRSWLLQTMETLFFAPFFLARFVEQKQLMEVVLFLDYQQDAYTPTIGAVIEIQIKRIEIYSAFLRIHAHFTGLRYLLYNYPFLSAVLGISSNFAFLTVLVLFSYLQWAWSTGEIQPIRVQQVDIEEDSELQYQDSQGSRTPIQGDDGWHVDDSKTVSERHDYEPTRTREEVQIETLAQREEPSEENVDVAKSLDTIDRDEKCEGDVIKRAPEQGRVVT